MLKRSLHCSSCEFPLFFLIPFLVFAASGLQAADAYILPSGAGARDGSSWENAGPGSQADFQAAWAALGPGDTLHVGSGTYENVGLSATKSGSEGNAIRLIGEDLGGGLPRFTSNFDKHKPDKTGATFFKAEAGTSNLEVSGFHIQAYRLGVYLRGRNASIKISDLSIEQARECIRSEGGAILDKPESGTHDVSISDCRFVHFTKRGIRLQGGNYNFRIERCYADAGGKEWATEPFHIGFQIGDKKVDQLTGGDHHLEFVDCTAVNSYHERGEKYWNADGWSAESMAHHLRYVRCVSMHHTDGGWDDKSESPELIDCVALDNKRNFRFWSREGTAGMTNCISGFAFKRGGSGSASGLWSKGSVEGQYCTFIENDSIQVEMEADSPDARITFKDSIVYAPNARVSNSGQVKFVDSIVSGKGDEPLDPGIGATKNTGWSPGSEQAYDSTKFGNKGFNTSRIGKDRSVVTAP